MTKSTQRYLDIPPKLMKSYNHSYHSSIKMAPMQVTSENVFQVFQIVYSKFPLRACGKFKMNFKNGDLEKI